MPNKNQINVEVVVGGVSTAVTVNTHQKVEHLAREALKQTGHEHADLEQWQLKDADGDPVSLEQTIEEAGLDDGAKLFLNKDEGGGG